MSTFELIDGADGLGVTDAGDGALGGVTFSTTPSFAYAAIGDFNGDGVGDFVIGAPGDAPGGATNAGAAHVLFGDASGLPDPLDVAQAASGTDLIEAPMPGLVKAVFVTAGQSVAEGDRLAILEAMKMEHTLTAWRDGTIAELMVEAGAQVEAGAALIRLEEEDEV